MFWFAVSEALEQFLWIYLQQKIHSCEDLSAPLSGFSFVPCVSLTHCLLVGSNSTSKWTFVFHHSMAMVLSHWVVCSCLLDCDTSGLVGTVRMVAGRKRWKLITLKIFKKSKWCYPQNRPWRPVGLWDVKDPTYLKYCGNLQADNHSYVPLSYFSVSSPSQIHLFIYIGLWCSCYCSLQAHLLCLTDILSLYSWNICWLYVLHCSNYPHLFHLDPVTTAIRLFPMI
jgi:hypothetical protein